jgi:hypothetical protein
MAATELPSQEGRVPSCGTRGSTGAPPQEGRSQSPGTHGNAGAHLSKEVRFGAMGHVVAPELTSARRQSLEPRDTWRLQSLPLQGGVV